MKEFFYEFERIRTAKVSDDELKDAKSFLTGVFPLRAETQEGLTNLIVSREIYGLPENYLETYRDRVNEVTSDEVLRVAEKYVVPENFAMVVVGDAGEILPQLGSYSQEIKVVDVNGKDK